MTATATVARKRLPVSDLTRLSTVGLRTRKLRAGLSALGIAIGVAAIVAVLGLSASSQAGLWPRSTSSAPTCSPPPTARASLAAPSNYPPPRRP